MNFRSQISLGISSKGVMLLSTEGKGNSTSLASAQVSHLCPKLNSTRDNSFNFTNLRVLKLAYLSWSCYNSDNSVSPIAYFSTYYYFYFNKGYIQFE